ncbi:murein DD-endopeptidase MepM/ murein hydrolase activator NlpD [Ruminiclostridium sufflavum DSM 19573]|uniref:Murein DD-endopeptidase MepM/ murein hydrolase activator NlpD n=1 Tax=Ruminiclostridium sufflavum DSM 19573 TaxID=1121337 RepID=A0A318XNQ6_9FIRM|nr:M23 family metallopeptidase [Ruminiclostridium sufflavum]PYG89386.1 murein DD-endopeptidase MepM/ murein hydrolase activator NlpD [Ruminiclostridium sufflavum DSM 19573]
MKVSSIIKKLNKTYSIVIIPNSNDSVKRYSLKAPFAKILLTLLIVFSVSITVYLINYSQKSAQMQEISREELQQQIQTLSLSLIKQNEALSASNNHIQELQSRAAADKDKIDEFTKMYKEIADNYISKSSRGTSSKNVSISQTGMDLIKLNNVVEKLNENFNNDGQLLSELKNSKTDLEKIVDAIPTLAPASGKIGSPFGIRMHPIKKVKIAHDGVDISSSSGDPILASASGVVEYAGYSNGYGYNVIIDHKNGFRTIYAHSSKLLVKKGDSIDKGQKIALVGSTGLSTGPHLHFEIRIGNTPVDPTLYVDF